MVNLSSDKCLEEDCKLEPSFGEENSNQKLYCSFHKKKNMVNIRTKKCIEKGCKSGASYKEKGSNIRIYCSKHKKENMERKGLCKRCNKKEASFKMFGSKSPLYCKTCLTTEEETQFINRKSKKCKTCNLLFQFRKKLKLCSSCNPNSMQRTKENEIKKLLQENFIEFIHDKYITEQETCLSYKPDFVIENEKNIVILEVDEEEHKRYKVSCELSRMYNIIAYFTEKYQKPVKFIRYNPDSKERNKQKKLIETLKENSEEVEDMSIVYLFYSEERKADLIKADI